jgi:hypothetical protein
VIAIARQYQTLAAVCLVAEARNAGSHLPGDEPGGAFVASGGVAAGAGQKPAPAAPMPHRLAIPTSHHRSVRKFFGSKSSVEFV